MRYETTVTYKDKQVKIKMPFKKFEGEFSLPIFLKEVRELNNKDLLYVATYTGWDKFDCEDFENGSKDIPKQYLTDFIRVFKIPAKLKFLGFLKEEETKKIFSARLKDIRIQKGFSQEVVACELGVARSTYACYEVEKNTPDFHTLIKLADYFDVSLDYLTGRDKFVK